jgi:hypothetical protein
VPSIYMLVARTRVAVAGEEELAGDALVMQQPASAV